MSKHTVTARRRTFDGVLIQFWTDGAVTVGHETSNRLVARGLDRQSIGFIADDVCLYDAGDVKALVAAARKAVASMADLWSRSAVLGRDPVEHRRLFRAHAARIQPSVVGLAS